MKLKNLAGEELAKRHELTLFILIQKLDNILQKERENLNKIQTVCKYNQIDDVYELIENHKTQNQRAQTLLNHQAFQQLSRLKQIDCSYRMTGQLYERLQQLIIASNSRDSPVLFQALSDWTFKLRKLEIPSLMQHAVQATKLRRILKTNLLYLYKTILVMNAQAKKNVPKPPLLQQTFKELFKDYHKMAELLKKYKQHDYPSATKMSDQLTKCTRMCKQHLNVLYMHIAYATFDKQIILKEFTKHIPLKKKNGLLFRVWLAGAPITNEITNVLFEWHHRLRSILASYECRLVTPVTTRRIELSPQSIIDNKNACVAKTKNNKRVKYGLG